MSKRILDYDHATRTTTWHHYDPMTQKTYIETVQDIKPYLERNKQLQKDALYGSRGKKAEFMHIATIPNNVILKLKEEYGIDAFNSDDLPKLERLLNTREWMYLRTVDRI